MNRTTQFSACRKYRFTLWRGFESGLLQESLLGHGNVAKPGFVQFIGLNPSTADETLDDPTIRRCIGFSKLWGYGAFCMTNIFPFRATDPKDMMLNSEPDEMRIENANHVVSLAKQAGIVICAWGVHGKHLSRGQKFIDHFRKSEIKVHHLGLTSGGFPKHPLYLRADTKPILWV